MSPADPGLRHHNQEALLPGAPAPSDWWNPGKDVTSSWHMLSSSWLNLLILCCPLGIISPHVGWSASATFLLVRGEGGVCGVFEGIRTRGSDEGWGCVLVVGISLCCFGNPC